MPKTFSVASSSSAVSVTKERDTTVRFTVTNTRDGSARGRAILKPIRGAEDDWLQIDGEDERDFAEDQTDDFLVNITVPASVSAGRYALRLDMAAVDNPDEDYTAGPEVAIDVEVPSPPPNGEVAPGYITTVVGTAIGGLAGLAVAGIVTAIVALVLGEISDSLSDLFGSFLLMTLVFLPGPWIGTAIGSGLALSMRGYRGFTATSIAMAVIFPIWTMLAIVLLSSVTGSEPASNVLLIVIGLIMPPLWLVVPALASRFAALMAGGGRG